MELTYYVLAVDWPDVEHFRDVIFQEKLRDQVYFLFLLVEVGQDSHELQEPSDRHDSVGHPCIEDVVRFCLVGVK